MRTLTNWLGNSAPSSLPNSAFIFTVPVAVSIWLSAVSSLPVASFSFCSRSQASTTVGVAVAQALHHARHVVLGNREHALIGCSCAMTTMPLASDARTTLPGSTWRRPTRPEIGAVTRAYDELQLRVVDRALVGLHRALVLAHQRLLRVDLLLRDRILREQRAIALEVDLRVVEQRLVLGELAAGLRELHLERTRIDLGEEIARPSPSGLPRSARASAGRRRAA